MGMNTHKLEWVGGSFSMTESVLIRGQVAGAIGWWFNWKSWS